MPNNTIKFLTLDEVLEIHRVLIDEFGGATGIRDKGLLESALYRPRSGYYEDILQMAAALFESLLFNHAFVDGNKRIAFFATDVFLRINGFKFNVDTNPAYEFIIGVLEESQHSFEDIHEWIKKSVVELSK